MAFNFSDFISRAKPPNKLECSSAARSGCQSPPRSRAGGTAQQIALQQVDSQCDQCFLLSRRFHAFGHGISPGYERANLGLSLGDVPLGNFNGPLESAHSLALHVEQFALPAGAAQFVPTKSCTRGEKPIGSAGVVQQKIGTTLRGRGSPARPAGHDREPPKGPPAMMI